MFWPMKSKPKRRRRRSDFILPPIIRILAQSMIGITMLLSILAGLCYLLMIGVNRLDAHVKHDLLSENSEATIVFSDLPESLERMALDDLYTQISDLLDTSWTRKTLCQEMTERLERAGWIDKLHYVRRSGNGQIQISANYRIPVAMIQQKDRLFLIDTNGVRLPGQYRYDSSWRLIQGISEVAPVPGELWEGADVQAGLSVWAFIDQELFTKHIKSVLVNNFGGRVNPRATHIELVTDHQHGRIRWGSAPGFEIEENTISQKLAILRANYRETGRADANHKIIDITTYPDHFTISG